MDRWIGKVAVVTGASSGIGLCISKDLLKHGLIVIGLARRLNRLNKIKDKISDLNGEFHPYECDVSSLDSIKSAFSWINEKFGRINILINNAGCVKFCGILTSGNEDQLKNLIETNLLGAVNCTKQMFYLMKDKDEECHIINMNSILGHYTPLSIGSMTYNLYPSSKFALRAASEVLRHELIEMKNFRVTNLSPGLVKTDILHAANHLYADMIMDSTEILDPDDVSRTVIFVLGLLLYDLLDLKPNIRFIECPKHVQITEMVIMPVGQKF